MPVDLFRKTIQKETSLLGRLVATKERVRLDLLTKIKMTDFLSKFNLEVAFYLCGKEPEKHVASIFLVSCEEP